MTCSNQLEYDQIGEQYLKSKIKRGFTKDELCNNWKELVSMSVFLFDPKVFEYFGQVIFYARDQ